MQTLEVKGSALLFTQEAATGSYNLCIFFHIILMINTFQSEM